MKYVLETSQVSHVFSNVSTTEPSLQELVDDHNKRSEALCKHLPAHWRTGNEE